MIQVLLFAQLQEKTGKNTLWIEEAETTIAQLKDKHLAGYDMADLLKEAMVAVNEEYAAEDTVIRQGDVVAFIPPVSGG